MLEICAAYRALDKEQKTFFIIKQQNDAVEVTTLRELNKNLISESDERANIYFAFADTSTSESYPGWPLRNYVALLLYHW